MNIFGHMPMGFNNYSRNVNISVNNGTFFNGFVAGGIINGLANIFGSIFGNKATSGMTMNNQCYGINSGVYGVLNTNAGYTSPQQKSQTEMANLKALFTGGTVLQPSGDGTYTIKLKDETLVTGTYDELLAKYNESHPAKTQGKSEQGTDT